MRAIPILLACLLVPIAHAQTVLDPGFGNFAPGVSVLPVNQGGTDADWARALLRRPDGHLVLVGDATTLSGPVAVVLQLDESGLPDPMFGGGDGRLTFIDPAGPTANLSIRAAALQPDGKILVSGLSDAGIAVVYRVLADGSGLDPAFSTDGAVHLSADQAGGVAVDGDGRVVFVGSKRVPILGGTNQAYRILVARWLANGNTDTDFADFGTGTFDFPYGETRDYFGRAVVVDYQDRILAGATIRTDQNGLDFGALRLLADGSPDVSFGNVDIGRARVHFDVTGQACNDDQLTAIAFHHSAIFPSTDRVLLAGSACRFDGNVDFGIARLLADGTLDTAFAEAGRRMIAFDVDAGPADEALAMVFQNPSGFQISAPSHLVVAGTARRSALANHDLAIARLSLGDGSLDTTFGTGGKIVVALELGGPNAEFAAGVVADAGRITVAGTTSRTMNSGADRDFTAVRLIADLSLFANGFE